MRRNASPILFVLLTLWLVNSTFADVYTIETNKNSHDVNTQLSNDDDVAYLIQPTKDLSLTDAEHLSVPLPNGEVWTAVKTDSYATEHGWAWFGELTAFAGGPKGRLMLIALEDGMFLGEFSLGDDHFSIWPQPESGEHELIQKAPSKISSCALEDFPELSSDVGTNKPLADLPVPSQVDAAVGDLEAKSPALMGSDLKKGDVVRLDILPLYHSAVGYTKARNQYIAWVNQANQVFRDSNIPAMYSLVSDPIAINAAAENLPDVQCQVGLEASMAWMQGRPDVVMRLRNQYGADFVTLAIPQSTTVCGVQGGPRNDACGIASLPWRDIHGKKVSARSGHFWTQRSFVVIREGCGLSDLTFAHEMAHTFGARHDPTENFPAAGSPMNPTAYGFEFLYDGSQHATVMDCVTETNGTTNGKTTMGIDGVCNRVTHFSSATELGPDDLVIGDSAHDNRQLIVNKVEAYEAFRSRGGPTVRILSPSRNSVVDFQSNHFEVEASEVVQGATVDLSDQVIWRVRTLKTHPSRDHVIFGMGQGRSLTNVDFSSLSGQVEEGTQFELIAVVEGSSGARASWRIPITFDMRLPEARFSESCSTLECLFDASASTAVGGVTKYRWIFELANCAPGPFRDCGEVAEVTSPSTSHYFRGYGAYDVSLVVEDALGRSSTRVTELIDLEAPSGSFAQVGAWYNPDRSGHGIDLYRNSLDQYVVYWYTYEQSEEPTWYLSDTASIIENQFSARLYKVTRATNGSLTNTILGYVHLDFSDPSTAAFQWDFSLNGEVAFGWERFEHHYGANLRTGAWHAPSDSGWGLQVNEEWSGSNPGSLVALAFYDNAGQPRWVSGFQYQNPVQQNVTVSVNYHLGENLCPFESCFAGTPLLTFLPAGSVTLQMPLSGNPGHVVTSIDVRGTTWDRNKTIQRLSGY